MTSNLNARMCLRFLTLPACLCVVHAATAQVLPATQISEDTLVGASGSEPDTEAEPYIAVDPNNPAILVAVFQEGRFATFGAAVGVGFACSHDAGRTWTAGNLPGLTVATGGLFARATDPVVAFGPDGAVYASTLLIDLPDQGGCQSAIAVQRSDDGGSTWNPPVFAAVSSCGQANPVPLDKDWMTVDTFPTSPHRGRIYVAWDGSPSGLTLTYSDDRGQSWSAPQRVAGGLFPILLVQPNGDLSIIGIAGATEVSVTSHDGGASFDPVVPIAAFEGDDLTDMRGGGEGNPAAAVDPVTGDLYAVWQDGRFRTDGLDDIILTRSADGGRTWGAVQRVNPDSTGSQLAHFTPAVGAWNGSVHVVYRTRDVSLRPPQFYGCGHALYILLR